MLTAFVYHKTPRNYDIREPVSGIEPESSAWKADMLAVTPHGQDGDFSPFPGVNTVIGVPPRVDNEI